MAKEKEYWRWSTELISLTSLAIKKWLVKSETILCIIVKRLETPILHRQLLIQTVVGPGEVSLCLENEKIKLKPVD